MSGINPFIEGIVYKTVEDLQILLDLYLPETGRDLPILLWFHGGGLLQGYRDRLAPHMRRASQTGDLAVITADYRLAPQASILEIREDILDCVKFVREQLPARIGDPGNSHAILDPSRLAVSGSSAGGYLALLAGLFVEPKPNCIIPIYPITDPLGAFFIKSQPPPPDHKLVPKLELANFLDPNSAPVASNTPESVRSYMYTRMLHDANLATLWHVPDGEGANEFRLSKQVHSRGCCPVYMLHGDADEAVGIEQADEVVGALVGCGVEVVYERVHAQGHLLDHGEEYENDELYKFIRHHLGIC